jgi:hypothetical protein
MPNLRQGKRRAGCRGIFYNLMFFLAREYAIAAGAGWHPLELAAAIARLRARGGVHGNFHNC